MTARLVALLDTADAEIVRDALNTCRDLNRKLADERRRHHNHTPVYTDLYERFQVQAEDIADALLDGAIYWDDAPDARVTALEEKLAIAEDRLAVALMCLEDHAGTVTVTDNVCRGDHA